MVTRDVARSADVLCMIIGGTLLAIGAGLVLGWGGAIGALGFSLIAFGNMVPR